MRRLFILPVIAGLTSPCDVSAQYGGRLAGVGARVRVDIADRVTWSPIDRPFIVQRLRGTISAVSYDTLYLDPADSVGAIAVPRMLIHTVSVSLGPRSRATSAVEVGTYGAVILALIFQGEGVNRNRRFGSSFRAASIGAGAGFVVGGLIGVVRPYERWRVAWLPD